MRPVHPATKTALSRAIRVINQKIAATVTALSFNGVNAYLNMQPVSFPVGSGLGILLRSNINNGGWNVVFANESWAANLGFVIYVQNGDLHFHSPQHGGISFGHVADGLIHYAEVNFDSSGANISLDGVSKGSNAGSNFSSFNPNNAYIGCRHVNDGNGQTDFGETEVFMVDFKPGTLVNGNPLNPLYYPGKNPELPYVPNERAPLEPSLAASFGVPTGASAGLGHTISGNEVTITATQDGLVYPNIRFDNFIEDQTAYWVTVEIDTTGSTKQGFIGVGDINSASEERITVGPGKIETKSKLLLANGAARLSFYIDNNNVSSGDSITFRVLEIREAPGYATKNGTAPDGSDSQSYKKMADGRLLNDASVLSNGHFDTGVSDWTLGPNWSWSNGKAVGVNLNAPDQYLRQTNVLDVGQEYLVKYAGAMSSGEFGIRNQAGYRDSTDWLLTPNKPLVEFEWVADFEHWEMKRYNTIGSIELDWVSAQPIISYAPGADPDAPIRKAYDLDGNAYFDSSVVPDFSGDYTIEIESVLTSLESTHRGFYMAGKDLSGKFGVGIELRDGTTPRAIHARNNSSSSYDNAALPALATEDLNKVYTVTAQRADDTLTVSDSRGHSASTGVQSGSAHSAIDEVFVGNIPYVTDNRKFPGIISKVRVTDSSNTVFEYDCDGTDGDLTLVGTAQLAVVPE